MMFSLRQLLVTLVGLWMLTGASRAQTPVTPNDDTIREAIKARCASYYTKRGGDCLCYEQCQRNSAYVKRQKAKLPVPFCNQSDISQDDIKQFRNKETRMIMERCDSKPPS
jgi:hypothetical protein